MNVGRWTRALAASAAAALGVVACGGGGGGGIGGTGGSMGTLRVSMTDAPACGYEHVWVTVKSVRVHDSSSAADQDTGWKEILVDPQTGGRQVDLLELRNGNTTLLGETTLEAGTYRQIRLVLGENSGDNPPFANAVQPTGGAVHPLDTPSAQQSGLKLKLDVAVPQGQVAHVLLDFDACKSVVKRGNSGRYNLKPVLSGSVLLEDAGLRVNGQLSLPAGALAATSVSVQASGPTGPVVAKATTPRADGSFTLSPVPAGTYDLVVTSPAYTTSVMTGVPVVSGTPTVVSNVTVPIAPALAASDPRAASGTVTPATATVRALQTFQAGPTVEVQAPSVDLDTGSFTFSLPVVAAQRTPFVTNLGAIANFPWITDATTPSAYTIEATDGVSRKSVPNVNVLAPTLPALNFTFP